jgi:hypothetical protein
MTSPTNIAADGCAAPDQSAPMPASVDIEKETLITGIVSNAGGEAVGGAYVRLLDSTGEFTAEVVSSDAGGFRFYAAPGTWELRALSPQGNARGEITADVGLNTAQLALG